MSVQVKFLAALRERMGRGDDTVEVDSAATVADVWARVSGDQPLPPSTLIAVNMQYTNANHKVKDGDEIAFLPPVTGG